MKALNIISASVLSGVVIAGSFASTAFAWQPKGQIEKLVQNQTTGSELTDHVTAHPGDILKYVIEISNIAKPAKNEWNDLHYIELTDKLPQGIELVSNNSERELKEKLGMLEPGEKVTTEYIVTVTSKTDGKNIVNEACYEGDSKVRDNHQEGCDDAKVTVIVPEPEEEPEEEPEPEVLSEVDDGKGGGQPTEPKVLPETGAASLAGMFSGMSGLSYAAHRFLTRRRK